MSKLFHWAQAVLQMLRSMALTPLDSTKAKTHMTNDLNTYQSRWGYHCCSRELFLKLKYLHKWYWQTVYDFHRWHRWWRKEPAHRVGVEPRYCPVFVNDAIWHKPVRTHGVQGYKIYPKTVIDLGIPALFHHARLPATAPVSPLDVDTQATIERLYEAVKQYVEAAASASGATSV